MNMFFSNIFDNKKYRLALTALVTLFFFHLFYGLQTLLPTNISWLLTVKHDWGTHYLGWHFFKNEDWHFPLGRIDNYLAPLGTNIGFTDSIPLLAIPFKLISFILPEDFQYFGWWLLLCHFTVTYYTVLLLQQFRIKGIFLFLAMLLAVTNPVLVYRGLHPSLCAHGLIIACFYLYYKPTTAETVNATLRYQLILVLLSALINPYLCFIVLGLALALWIKFLGIDKLISRLRFIKQVVFSCGGLLVLWYVTGMIGFGKKEDLAVEGGYGIYGMNLNSLYNSDGYSAFLPQLKQVSSSQYEGYMYLGLGMLLLVCAVSIYAIVHSLSKTETPSLFQKIKANQNRPLLVVLFLFALFAVTHVVSFNEHVLFTIPLPEFLKNLGGIFRASARFFWPVYYLLFLGTLIFWINSKWKPLLKTTFLMLVVFIQLYDIKLLFSYRKLSYGTYNPPVDIRSWTIIMNQFDTIVMYPPFTASYKESMDYQYFSYLAAKLRKPVTTGYVARYSSKEAAAFVDSLNDQIADGILPENTLYITTPAYAKNFAGARLNILDGYCFLFSENIKEVTLISTADEMNAKNKNLYDSVKALMKPPFVFVETTTLPSATTGVIRYMVEGVKQKNSFIRMNGWAYAEGTDNNKGDSVFITLTSPLKSYISSTAINPRPDVTGAFQKTYLDDAGFTGNIYRQSVMKGIYKLGLMIKKKDGQLLHQQTEQIIKVDIPEYGTMTPLAVLPRQTDITSNLEHTDITDSIIKISGWGFLNNQNAHNSEINFVLVKDGKYFVTATEPVLRSDVTAYFKTGFNFDNCGFAINYLKSQVPKGKYKTGIIIKDILTGKERAYLFVNEIDVQ